MTRSLVVAALLAALVGGACSSSGEPPPAPSARPLPERTTLSGPTELPPLSDQVDAYDEGSVTLVSLEGPQADLPVRVAPDEASDAGLPGVTEMPGGVGVLARFADGTDGAYRPAALGTAVDAVFIGSSLVVLDIVPAEACSGDCPELDPGTSYVAVLLVAQGWLEANGFVEPLRAILEDATAG